MGAYDSRIGGSAKVCLPAASGDAFAAPAVTIAAWAAIERLSQPGRAVERFDHRHACRFGLDRIYDEDVDQREQII